MSNQLGHTKINIGSRNSVKLRQSMLSRMRKVIIIDRLNTVLRMQHSRFMDAMKEKPVGKHLTEFQYDFR